MARSLLAPRQTKLDRDGTIVSQARHHVRHETTWLPSPCTSPSLLPHAAKAGGSSDSAS